MKTETKARSKLGKYLDSHGISQRWLMNKVGKHLYSEMTVSRWCKGEAEPNNVAWILIVGVLECELDDIK